MKCNEKLNESDPDFSRSLNQDLSHTLKAAKLREQMKNSTQKIVIKKVHKNRKKC